MVSKNKILAFGTSLLLAVVSIMFLWNMPFIFSGLTSLNGYDIMGIWTGFWGVMVSLLQFFNVFVLVAMLIVGLIGILNTLKVTSIDIKIGKYDMERINRFILMVYAGLTFLLFIAVIIFGAVNSNNFFTIRICVGTFMALFTAIGAYLYVLLTHIKQNPRAPKAPKKEVSEAQTDVQTKQTTTEEKTEDNKN